LSFFLSKKKRVHLFFSLLSSSPTLCLSLSLSSLTRTVKRRRERPTSVRREACRERIRQQRGRRRRRDEEVAAVVAGVAGSGGGASASVGSKAAAAALRRRSRRRPPASSAAAAALPSPEKGPVQKPAGGPADRRGRRGAARGGERGGAPGGRPRCPQHVVALLVHRVHPLDLARLQLDQPPRQLGDLGLQGRGAGDGLLLEPEALPELVLGGRRRAARGVGGGGQLERARPELSNLLCGQLEGLGLGLGALPRGRQRAGGLQGLFRDARLFLVRRRGLPAGLEQLALGLGRPRAASGLLPEGADELAGLGGLGAELVGLLLELGGAGLLRRGGGFFGRGRGGGAF
jgi:hypothetical protein